MTLTFQSWIQAVWTSVMEPTNAARKVLSMGFPRDAMWSALALVAVLNVIMLTLLQLFSPARVAFEDQVLSLSPFAYAAIIGVFLVVFVFAIFQIGKMFGGTGTLETTLAIVVWFQSISLTLEAVQLVLVLISPAIASIFGLLSLGALIWCFVNFVNVLHSFENLGKSVFTIVLALIGTALVAGILLTVLGVAPVGGMA